MGIRRPDRGDIYIFDYFNGFDTGPDESTIMEMCIATHILAVLGELIGRCLITYNINMTCGNNDRGYRYRFSWALIV